ncbi:MAG: hypothetical protein HYY17_03860 [Planctomycetes bacterium]|nr:hypothetical protein [Planctomycetota bacterium]
MAAPQAAFLGDLEDRPIALAELGAARLYLGQGDGALEVVVVAAPHAGRDQIRAAWQKRHGGRPAPVLLVTIHDQLATLCGPTSDQVWPGIPLETAERLCRAALHEPNRHRAVAFLSQSLPEAGSKTPGLRNHGLFATHQLAEGLPRYPEWKNACRLSEAHLKIRDRKLIEALGFAVHPLQGHASILKTRGGAQVAVAVFLDQNESPDLALARFGDLSPVLYALHHADNAQVRYVIVSTGAALRLYSTAPGSGVGQRGRTETFAEVRLDLLRPEHAGYLWTLFSADALSAGGLVERVLDDSRRFASDLGARLRDRIYQRVVPKLAAAILKARRVSKPSEEQLTDAYRAALTLLFRLLFVAYAEDLDLLPYRTNDAYRRRAFKTKVHEASVSWREVALIFEAIEKGKPEWGIPTYDGGLFSGDANVSAIGAELSQLDLSDSLFAEAFKDLLVDEGQDGRGPVDFRSLGVRDFGTIYEGLLENELAVAESDLAVGKENRYEEAKRGDEVAVKKGDLHLRNRSGQRKSTGSYYTKRFAVDHLLEKALVPALEAHLARLDKLDDKEAGAAFFDFRVADIAMGSGHFLVAAIDVIERHLSGWIAKRPIQGVRDELKRLRKSAEEALGDAGEGVEIEDTQLLRRQIARRCVYGVDVNDEAVQLARLSIWVHTFVPGLPLSVLDRNIRRGNSLVGIATLKEAETLLNEADMGLYVEEMRRRLTASLEPLRRLAMLSEQNAAEVTKARREIAEAEDKVEPAAARFDILTARRVNPGLSLGVREEDLPRERKRAREALAPLEPFHFPLAFPEVFLREPAGFDVMLGNPPWEEATLEEDSFWTRWHPRLQGLPAHEAEKIKKKFRRDYPDRVKVFEREKAEAEALRRVLTCGAFPGMGKGDPDTYKAFAWRFWHLIRKDGRIGVVLPRSALAAAGSGEWRKELFATGHVDDLTLVLNRGGWVFDDAEYRYTIALAALSARPPAQEIPLRGPFTSLEQFDGARKRDPVRVPIKAIEAASDHFALPLLSTPESLDVWLQMRKSPRLDAEIAESWDAKPYAEFHATNDKPLMKLVAERPDGFWPIFKGESFDIWGCDRGEESYYAWGNPERLVPYLQSKRQESIRRRSSAMADLGLDWALNKETLPCLHPRIAFRDVTNRTNQRTVIAALVPPKVFLTNKAPYLLWPRGDEMDQAYLLGVLCSIPLDWYARCHVEVSLNYHIFNPFPVPRPGRTDAQWKRVVALAGRLAAQDRRFAAWAKAVGVECGRISEAEKEGMVAELDAVVARLYGLTGAHVRQIFETFHEGWEYEERLARVLRHFQQG